MDIADPNWTPAERALWQRIAEHPFENSDVALASMIRAPSSGGGSGGDSSGGGGDSGGSGCGGGGCGGCGGS